MVEVNSFNLSISQLEEEVAAARVERETQLERAWGQLAASVKQHQADTSLLRSSCQRLQERVDSHRATLASVTTATKEMQVAVVAVVVVVVTVLVVVLVIIAFFVFIFLELIFLLRLFIPLPTFTSSSNHSF